MTNVEGAIDRRGGPDYLSLALGLRFGMLFVVFSLI